MLFFTANIAFGFSGALNNPRTMFRNVNDMDGAIIEAWNEVVSHNDTVYVLGNFAAKEADQYLKTLNGSVFLLRGSYDDLSALNFEAIYDARMITVPQLKGQYIWLSHFAHYYWPRQKQHSWHLHGSGTYAPNQDWPPGSCDVSLNSHRDSDVQLDFKPFSLLEIQQQLTHE